MIRTAFLVAYNLLRTAVMMLFHPVRFKASVIQRLSPRCSLVLRGKGVMEIGRNCEAAPYCYFEVHGDGKLQIGAGCYFNRFCMISAQQSVTIGERCMFGPGVKIFDNDHVHSAEEGVGTALKTSPISIGSRSWICSDVIILRGTRIGRNCVIGAGNVIKGDIPDGTVVPARTYQKQ